MAKKSSQLENTENTENQENESTAIAPRDDDALEARTIDLADETDESLDTDADDTDENANDGATDETEQLREQIDATRRDMGETIDAIQEKLSISHISEQVKDQVSEQIGGVIDSVKSVVFGKADDYMKVVSAGVKELSKSDVVKTAAKYPWLLSLVGMGVGALVVSSLAGGGKSGKKRSSSGSKYRYGYNDDEIRYSDSQRRSLKSGAGESTSPGVGRRIGDGASSTYDSVSGAASSAYEGLSDAAGTAYDGASSAASSAYDSAASAADSAYKGIGSAASKTYESVGKAASASYRGISTAAGYTYEKAGDLGGQAMKNYDYYIEENPLAVGAVAVLLGAAVGFAIPLTQKENEYLGEYRDAALEKAQATAQDALGSVKEMASQAQKVITEEVKSKTA